MSRVDVVAAISDKELRQLARRAQAQGWVLTRTRNGHVRWVSPAGQVSFSGSTPGTGGRALANQRAILRRHGLED